MVQLALPKNSVVSKKGRTHKAAAGAAKTATFKVYRYDPETPDNPRVDSQGFFKLDPSQRGGANLSDLLTAFNQLKVEARDRIAILRELHRSGKLHAQLVLE